ncbi:MAG TPA: arsinothricin resistance N-acetyltransferase ArsN1 family A [Methylomirabilota bacterium]
MSQALTLRDARQADAAAICLIYNQGIEDRVATLETELRTPEERREWLAARGPRHPVLVAEAADSVVAWASLNPFSARRAYDTVADLSIYVERGWRGKGVGRELLAGTIERARALAYHKMVLAALASNAPGEALYRRAGFSRVGVYREQGLLDGRWTEVLIMEKLL